MEIYKQLEQFNLRKPLFYYDCHTCVCLLSTPEGEPIARGIAICSPFDVFSKKAGRQIALGRALRAIKKRDTTGEIRPYRFSNHRSFYPRHLEEEAGSRLYRAKCIYGYKSVYLPTLHEFEKGIISPKKVEYVSTVGSVNIHLTRGLPFTIKL